MSRHAYPRSALLFDYARSVLALPFLALAVFASLNPFLRLVFAACGLLLAVFFLRTWLRHRTAVVLEEDGITLAGPLGGRIRWSELDRLRLRYFSTRRDRQNGWMELTLHAGKSRLRLESDIEGFRQIAAAALEAARTRGLALDETTEINLSGLDLHGSGPMIAAAEPPPGVRIRSQDG